MKTSFKMVAMLLGIGIFPVCTHAQKKVVIEDEEPNSIMFDDYFLLRMSTDGENSDPQ